VENLLQWAAEFGKLAVRICKKFSVETAVHVYNLLEDDVFMLKYLTIIGIDFSSVLALSLGIPELELWLCVKLDVISFRRKYRVLVFELINKHDLFLI